MPPLPPSSPSISLITVFGGKYLRPIRSALPAFPNGIPYLSPQFSAKTGDIYSKKAPMSENTPLLGRGVFFCFLVDDGYAFAMSPSVQ